MKKLVFILFLISGIAFSQTITPRLGLNIDQAGHSSLIYDHPGAAYSEHCIHSSYPPYYKCDTRFERFEGDKQSYKWGYHIGANVDYPLFKFLDVEAGIFYTTRGTAYGGIAKNQEGTSQRGTFSERTEIHALYFPLNLKFNIRITNSFKFNILAGGYMDKYLSGKRIFKIRSHFQEDILEFGKDAYNPYGFSNTFGVGFTYKSVVFRLTADVDANPNDISREKNISTQSFMFSLGYQFNLKKKQL